MTGDDEDYSNEGCDDESNGVETVKTDHDDPMTTTVAVVAEMRIVTCASIREAEM